MWPSRVWSGALVIGLFAAGPLPGAESNDVSLNGTWRLAVAAPADAERLARFFEPGFDEAAFRDVPVPSNWSLQGFADPVYGHVTDGADGFYRHRFRLPAAEGERRALLHFGGVWPSAEVWLNGKEVGRHDSGFTSVAFDVTRLLAEGENLLAVRVRQGVRDAGLDTNDDWSLPGIYRDVRIERMPRSLYLDRLEVTTDFDDAFRDADLLVRAFVFRQEAGSRPPFDVRARLTGPDSRTVQEASFTGSVTGGHNGRDVFLKMRVPTPAPWTAETPVLYDLAVDLVREGQVVHTRTERVGFREVSTAGGVLRVNGRPVKLRGVCRHDEHPDAGRATRREHWEQDLRLMKAANVNTVRTSHYPPQKGFLRLCDELGFYVIDEVPTGYGGDRLSDPSFAGAAMLRARETVARDRNHPSVIVWSVGNEDPLTALHIDLVRAVKGMDPTRPTLLPWRAEPELPPEVDILAPHYPSAEDLDRLAVSATRPVITTEYTHALGAEDFGGLEQRWRSLIQHPAGAGGTIWLWADQGLRRAVAGRRVREPLDLGYRMEAEEILRHSDAGGGLVYDARGVYGEDGIVNPDRSPQRDYWETKAVYAPVRVLDEDVNLRPGQARVAVRLANEYDFIDLETVRVSWRLMAGDRERARGEARVQAAPGATGTLDLPLAGMTSVPANVAAYFVLQFLRPDGSEMAERSVRLRRSDPNAPAAAPPRAAAPAVAAAAGRVQVSAGGVSWTFDPAEGRLTAGQAGGRTFMAGARLTLWRPMTISERNHYTRRERPPVPALERYATGVTRWEVVEAEGEVRIEVGAEHRFEGGDSAAAVYRFVVASDGALTLDYEVSPRLSVPWIPEVGLALEMPPGLDRLRWQGLGPLEATPNKRAAARFGVFSAARGEPLAFGTKAGIEWAELQGEDGIGLRVTEAPFVRYETTPEPPVLRALAAVQGSFTKFPARDGDAGWLKPGEGSRFSGRVRMAPVTPERTAAPR